MSLSSALSGIVHQVCPRCRIGPIYRTSIFRRWLDMNKTCPICFLKLDREPGYFLGAMYVSYGISIVPMLLLALMAWRLTRWSLDMVALIAFFGYLPFVPFVVRISRVIWIYLDQAVDPE